MLLRNVYIYIIKIIGKILITFIYKTIIKKEITMKSVGKIKKKICSTKGII